MIDFQNIEDAQTLAQAIVNTIPEPFIVLDDQFRVLAASHSFHETFKFDPEYTRGRLLYALGDGQWNIPALRVLLETIIPEHASMEDAVILVTYEIRGSDWKLIVSDNGIGKQADSAAETSSGLGTAIVQALAKQLDARVDIVSNPSGTSVSVTRATFPSQLQRGV